MNDNEKYWKNQRKNNLPFICELCGKQVPTIRAYTTSSVFSKNVCESCFKSKGIINEDNYSKNKKNNKKLNAKENNDEEENESFSFELKGLTLEELEEQRKKEQQYRQKRNKKLLWVFLVVIVLLIIWIIIANTVLKNW